MIKKDWHVWNGPMESDQASMKKAAIILIPILLSLFGCASNFLDASRRGEIVTVKKYLEENVDVNIAGKMGRTALMQAAMNGHLEVVKMLLDKGADVNLLDYRGWSALHQAANHGRLEISSQLIDRGADINSCQQHRIYTPFISAAISCHYGPSQCSEILQLLYNRGADINAECHRTTALKEADDRETKAFIKSLNKGPRQYGWTIGISGKDGKINKNFVRQTIEELKNTQVPHTKTEYMEKCRELGGIPNSCTGKVFSKSSLPVMGGHDCVICNPRPKQEKCYDNNGIIPCPQAGDQFTVKDNGDGTVTDFDTGLIWQQATAVSEKGKHNFTWQKAFDYCDDLIFANHSDWRLPTKFELHSIVDIGRRPAINPIFSGPYRSHFWSATTNTHDTRGVWFVDFDNGYDGRSWKNESNKYVRCVCGPER